MKHYTDKQKEEFLLKLAKDMFSQGDSYFAFLSKKGKWHFGYKNDYPMQHGDGSTNFMTDRLVRVLMHKLGE